MSDTYTCPQCRGLYHGLGEICQKRLEQLKSEMEKEIRRGEARNIFHMLWDEDGAPLQRDDPPREILNYLNELETKE